MTYNEYERKYSEVLILLKKKCEREMPKMTNPEGNMCGLPIITIIDFKIKKT